MLVLTIYIVAFTIGLPANIFVFATLLSTARRRRLSSSTILLLNLTAADLLLLLFLPFKMVEAAAGMTWPLPIVLCPVANYCFYSTIYLSSLFLAALSVERYLSVVFPLHYTNQRRAGRAMAASLIIWLLACSHCSIVFAAEYHSGRNPPTTNSSAVIGSADSKMSNPDGLNSNGFSISDHEYSTTDGFLHSRSISSADGFNPDDFKMSPLGGSITHGFNPSSSKISSPTGAKPKVFRNSDSTDNSFVPRGSKTTNGAISTRNGSRISNRSKPQTSKPNISTSKTSTRHGATAQAASGSSASSRTSTGPSSTAPIVRDGSNATNVYKCYDDFSEEQLRFVLPLRLELFLVLFLLPFAVTIFCYINFVRVLLARPNISLEKKQRAVGLAVATMVNFGVCFAPYNISHVVGFVEKKSPAWRTYALLFTSLNAALDPVIFYFSSTAVQKATAGVVGAVRDKLRGFVGLCYGAFSPGTSQGESVGSST
ncbi:free fatty acid receptor 2-like [Calonectris borealis]|uniref:free fatty acid receptor 2-like n=1 Tax=Calonectris borealis TaxID=1323832 RepID=UPI003F4C1292